MQVLIYHHKLPEARFLRLLNYMHTASLLFYIFPAQQICSKSTVDRPRRRWVAQSRTENQSLMQWLLYSQAEMFQRETDKSSLQGPRLNLP